MLQFQVNLLCRLMSLTLSSLLQAEVKYLGQLRHTNLVKLIGYCCEDEHRLLVYEYMASGSLEKHLFPSEYLNPMSILYMLVKIINSSRIENFYYRFTVNSKK